MAFLPRRPSPYSYTAGLDELYRVPPPSIARAAGLPEPAPEPEPEESPIASVLRGTWDAAKGVLNTGSAATGLVAANPHSSYNWTRRALGALPGGLERFLPDTTAAYERAFQDNTDAASAEGTRNLSIGEILAAAPGPGQVGAEALLPGQRQTAPERILKNTGSLVGDMVLDPTILATGGLSAAAQAAKEGRLLSAGAKVLGSAPAAAIYAPDIVRGTYESGSQAVDALRKGRPGDAVEPGIQALLTGGLGLLMAHGAHGEVRDFRERRAPRTLAEAAAREQPPAPAPAFQDAPPAAPLPARDPGALEVPPDILPGPPVAPDAGLEALAAVPPPSAGAALPVDAAPMSPSEALRARLAREGAAAPPPVVPEALANPLPESVPAIPVPEMSAPDVPPAVPVPPAPRAAPPERRAKVQRGQNGAVDIEFEDPRDKELFSASGRSRRAMRGEPGIDANFEGLGKQYGTDTSTAMRVALAYREQVMDAVRDLPEGEVFRAPRPAFEPQGPPTPAPGTPGTPPAAAATPAEPRYAFRARNVGEQGVPAVSHAQASLSEADVRRVAPSRTEDPQEVVRVNLDSLKPEDYEVVDRPGQPSWVRFTRELPETAVERVGPVDAVDVAAASKAEPPVRAAVATADTADLAQVTGLSMEAARKGADDVAADGVREFSPEAVAIKRAVIAGQVDVPETMTRRQASKGKDLPKDERGQTVYPGEEALTPVEREALNGVVNARVRELEMANQSQPTGRRPILGGPALNDVQGYQGTPSHKTGTALEGIPEGPKEIAAAIERDRGNALELRVREAILQNDEELGAHLDRLAAESGAGDDSFPVEKYAVRPAPGRRALEGIADDVPPAEAPRARPEQGNLFRGADMLQPSAARVTEGREADGPIFQKPEAQPEQATLPTEKYATAPKVPPDAPAPRGEGVPRDVVAKAFPTGKISDHPEGGHLVELPGDRQIRVDQVGTVSYRPGDFRKGYGRGKGAGESIAGKWKQIDRGGLIQLAKDAPPEPTLLHESFHAAMDLALSDAEHAAVLKRYGTEEKAADAYGTWQPAKQTNSWFSKIYAFARNLVRSFSPTWESTFERVRSGKAFEGPGRAPKPAPAAGGAPPKEPPGPRPGPIGLEPEAADAGARHGGTSKGKPPETLINLDRIAEPKDVREIEGRVQEALRERGHEARSYRSWSEARDRAVESGLTEKDVKRLLKEKGSLSDVEIEAGRMLRETAFKDMRDKLETMRKLQMDGKDYGEAERAYNLAAAKAAGIMLTTVRAGGEAGRALAIHRKMSTAMTPAEASKWRAKLSDPKTPEAEKYAIRQKLAQASILSEQEQLLQRAFKQLPAASPEFGARFLATPEGDHRAMAALLRAEFRPTLRDKAFEGWVNGLLSGPPTHLANITSNLLTQLVRIPEKAMAAGLDAARSAVTGRPRERFLGETYADIMGFKEGIKKGVRAMVADWQDEFNLSGGGKLEHKVGSIGGRFGSFVRAPGRALSASDQFFKAMAATRESRGLAYRKARAEGKTGKALGERIEDILSDLESHPEIMEGMQKEAEYVTFTKKLGKFGQMIASAREADPSGLAKIIVPFLKTPLNIGAFAAERTPLNLLRILAKPELRNADEVSKAAIGTMIGLGFALAAKEGIVTGGGPTDPKENELWRQTGKQPYSIKVGDEWLSYKRLQPVSSIVGTAADLVETSDERSQGDKVLKIASSFADNWSDQTFWQGVEGASQALSDPRRYFSQWAKGVQGSIVPSVVARAAQAIDPKVRETSAGDGSAILARLPGLSMTLPEKRRSTGEPIERESTALERFASPFPRTTEKGKEADLERAFLAAGYTPSAPSRFVTIPKAIGGRGQRIELTSAELAYLRDVDERVSQRLREVVADPRFARMDQLAQRRYFEGLYNKTGDAALKRLWGQRDLRQRAAATLREQGGRA